MSRPLTLVLCLALTACGYMSRNQFDALFDADGDGWGVDEDCNDNNPDIHPFAPDVRGDGCDADCGTTIDSDGDDWPDAADCDPTDPTIYPCSPHEVEGDGIDHDCDGLDGVRTIPCNTADGFDDNLGLDPDFVPSLTAVDPRTQTVLGPDCLDP